MRLKLKIVNVMFAQAVELLRQTTSRLVDRFMPDLLLHRLAAVLPSAVCQCLFDFSTTSMLTLLLAVTLLLGATIEAEMCQL